MSPSIWHKIACLHIESCRWGKSAFFCASMSNLSSRCEFSWRFDHFLKYLKANWHRTFCKISYGWLHFAGQLVFIHQEMHPPLTLHRHPMCAEVCSSSSCLPLDLYALISLVTPMFFFIFLICLKLNQPSAKSLLNTHMDDARFVSILICISCSSFIRCWNDYSL